MPTNPQRCLAPQQHVPPSLGRVPAVCAEPRAALLAPPASSPPHPSPPWQPWDGHPPRHEPPREPEPLAVRAVMLQFDLAGSDLYLSLKLLCFQKHTDFYNFASY